MALPQIHWLLATLLLSGCGKSERPRPQALTLEQVPAPLLAKARETLPGVKFDRAWKTPDGLYEITGKERNGRKREVELNEPGEVVEIE